MFILNRSFKLIIHEYINPICEDKKYYNKQKILYFFKFVIHIIEHCMLLNK